MAFDSAGDLFAANENNNTVSEFTSAQTFASVGTAATGDIRIESSLGSEPITLGGTTASAGAGIDLTSAELALLSTSATGTVTIGDSNQTGNISFVGATLATTAGANTDVVQSTAGAGEILFDDPTGTALNGNGGTVTLTPGTGQLGGTLSAGNPPISSNGFTATGLTFNLSLPSLPSPGQTFSLVDDTGSPVSGDFANLTPGATVTVSANGTPYFFGVSSGPDNAPVLTADNPEPTVEFISASEQFNASDGTFTIIVGLSNASVLDTTIPFTLGGTAVAGTDYSGVTSPLVIAAGQTFGTITGTLLSDPGASQTLTFTLGTPTNATLGSDTVNTLTITEVTPTSTPTPTPTPTSTPMPTPTLGGISGEVFVDTAGTGVPGAGSTPVAGVTVFVDENGTGVLAANDPVTTTDRGGHYSFAGLAPGLTPWTLSWTIRAKARPCPAEAWAP